MDPYSVLGLKPGASHDDVNLMYKRLARKYHPDTSPDVHAARKMIEINQARDAILHGKPFNPTQSFVLLDKIIARADAVRDTKLHKIVEQEREEIRQQNAKSNQIKQKFDKEVADTRRHFLPLGSQHLAQMNEILNDIAKKRALKLDELESWHHQQERAFEQLRDEVHAEHVRNVATATRNASGYSVDL